MSNGSCELWEFAGVSTLLPETVCRKVGRLATFQADRPDGFGFA